MDPVPDAGALPDLGALVNDGGCVCLVGSTSLLSRLDFFTGSHPSPPPRGGEGVGVTSTTSLPFLLPSPPRGGGAGGEGARHRRNRRQLLQGQTQRLLHEHRLPRRQALRHPARMAVMVGGDHQRRRPDIHQHWGQTPTLNCDHNTLFMTYNRVIITVRGLIRCKWRSEI